MDERRYPRAASLPEVRRQVIDGMPVFWAPLPGLARAALMFRVGRADETPATGGVTHIVEHLALTALGEVDYDFNAFVDHERTVFWAEGDWSHVAGFLRELTRALSDPPLGRLDAERTVLQVEAQSRSRTLTDVLLAHRYGPRGPGLVAYDELGLGVVSPEQIASWTSRYFTIDNAVAWLTGPPDGIELALPRCVRPPASAAPAVSMDLPACLAVPGDSVGAGMVVERSGAASAASRILERRLQSRLRHEMGTSYSVVADLVRLDNRSAHLAVGADSAEGRGSEVLGALLLVLDEFAQDGPTEAELDRDLTQLDLVMGGHDAAIAWLDAHAGAELFGDHLPKSIGDVFDELAGSAQTQATVVRAGLESLIALAPESQARPAWRFKESSKQMGAAIGGRRIPPIRGDAPARWLVVGDEGVTLVGDRGERVGVRFSECELLGVYDDGAHVLFGAAGSVVGVEPWFWRRGAELCREIASRVPPERRVSLGPGVGPPPSIGQVQLAASGRWVKPTALALWLLISATVALVAFLFAPNVSLEEVGRDISSLPQSEGYVACGDTPSVIQALGLGHPKGLPNDVASLCRAAAREDAAVGLVGVVSTAGAVYVGWRGWRRRTWWRRRRTPESAEIPSRDGGRVEQV